MGTGRTIAIVLAGLLSTAIAPSPTRAQAAQQPAYSTYNAKVGDLLANPTTRAVLERHFPGVSKDFRMKMVKGKTFRQLHEMAPDQLPNTKLDAVDRELRNVQRPAS